MRYLIPLLLLFIATALASTDSQSTAPVEVGERVRIDDVQTGTLVERNGKLAIPIGLVGGLLGSTVLVPADWVEMDIGGLQAQEPDFTDHDLEHES